MAGGDDSAHLVGDRLVIDNAGEFVAAHLTGCRSGAGHGVRAVILDRKVDIDADTLRGALLETVDANGGVQNHVAQEHVPERALRVGQAGRVHAAPSRISWPVMLGKCHMARIVAAMSAVVAGAAGAAPAACAAHSAG